MLADLKLRTLRELVENSTNEELIWMSGYLSGLTKPASQTDLSVKPSIAKLTIVYGTDTGNSKKLATEFTLKAKKAGVSVKLQSLDQYRLGDLVKEEYFLVVISTHGDGEPPAAASKFYDHLHEHALELSKLNYSVLALGDSAYPLFCKAGEDIDAQLEKLGATRFESIQKCDTDYETDAYAWFENVLRNAGSVSPSKSALPVVHKKSNAKKNYIGTILSNVNLNGRGSAKETYHIEMAAEEVHYLPGDSIGIIPQNPAEIVDAVMRLVNIDETKRLTYREERYTIETLLKRKLNIVYLPERVVRQYAAIVQQEIPATRIDLLNLLKIYPVRDAFQFEEVIGILEPITPRLYSIASSPLAHGGEVHLTVARKCFEVNEEVRRGLCSDYLAQLLQGASFEFYVHKNSQFKLPATNVDIIMIGPGTGIAPFRSFVAERDATGSTGRNWLFFGDQHFESDFLYQTEIQNYLETGVLTKVNVAFSRDQEAKLYVQHKMVEHGQELFNWLEAGAHVYVCGAKETMGVDVENSLLNIISEFGNNSAEQSQALLDQLKVEGRYQKDVY